MKLGMLLGLWLLRKAHGRAIASYPMAGKWGLIFSAILLSCGVTNVRAVDLVALDNTNNLAVIPGTSTASITATNWNARVFTVGAEDVVMKELVLPLYETGSATRVISIRLFGVNVSNNPTGSALAGDSFTQTFTNAAKYYTIPTTLGDFKMVSGQTYALVISSNSPGITMSWPVLRTYP